MAARGSIAGVMSELVDLAATIHPTLNVYRWWRPDMRLPAVWHWLTPASTERRTDCDVRDVMRVTVSVGIDPRVTVAEDMLELEAYADLAVDVYNAALYQPRPFGQTNALRQGFQTVSDELGGAPVLALELPLEVWLDRSVPPTP